MLKTTRLQLRSFSASDATALHGFMSNQLAMRHTYVAPSLEACTARLNTYEDMRSTLGFAPWVIETQSRSEIICWGGLSIDPEAPTWGLEVSYAFAPFAWGNGYATELVDYSLSHAFGILAAQEVRAFAKPANIASLRVLQKCGFRHIRFEPSLERNHYLIANPITA